MRHQIIEFLLRKAGYQVIDCCACGGSGADILSGPDERGDGSWSVPDCDKCDGYGEVVRDISSGEISTMNDIGDM